MIMGDRDRVNRVEDALRPPKFSDDALAANFAERHKNDLRYVAAWRRWLVYDGMRWRGDDTLHAFDLVRKICRQAAVACTNASSARTALASANTVAAVERLARADRRLAATIDQWDSDPLLLNTPGAVIDLRTGESRVPKPDDYMTKMTAVEPNGTCPIWERFINRIANDDVSLAKFLQRVIGYSLTGLTTEHALFFCYGTGANGKSVLIKTISDISAGYHKEAPIETFTASAVEHHPTDLAGLHGAPIVTSVETEEGRRWAEAKTFFAGSAAKRRQLLPQIAALEAAGNDGTGPQLAGADEARDFAGLDAAAMEGRIGAFLREFERLLAIPKSLCERILNDRSGEPMVIAAKAANMPIAVLQRILLLVNPAVSHSVQRVFDLSDLFHDIERGTAVKLMSLWRAQARNGEAAADSAPSDNRSVGLREASVRSRFGALADRIRVQESAKGVSSPPVRGNAARRDLRSR
jgi:hypothetical protein